MWRLRFAQRKRAPTSTVKYLTLSRVRSPETNVPQAVPMPMSRNPRERRMRLWLRLCIQPYTMASGVASAPVPQAIVSPTRHLVQPVVV